jgi:hypothetical protein
MLRAIEFYLNGKMHRLDLMQNITDPEKPKLNIHLTCPDCSVFGTIDKDQFAGRVSMNCQQKLNEAISLEVDDDKNFVKKMPKKQGNELICQYHETHNFLEMAKKQIVALEQWANTK